MESGCFAAGGVFCPSAAVAAREIIKKRQKILFMLDLTALARVSEPQLIGCNAAGGKVPLF